MKHSPKITRNLVGGLAAITFLVIMAIVVGNTPRTADAGRFSVAYPLPSRSPVSPTASGKVVATTPSPPRPTTVPPYPPNLTPTRSASRTPQPTYTPATSPTPAGPAPSGLKLIYGEKWGSSFTVWAASPQNPEYRHPVLQIEDPKWGGVRIALAHRAARVAYTVMPANSRQDRYIADLWLADLTTGERRQLASRVDLGGGWNYPTWSPDDRWVAFARQSAGQEPYRRAIAILDTATGQEITLVTTEGDSAWTWPLDWSPDGRYFYYLKGIARCELWRVETTAGNRSEFVRLVSESGMPQCFFVAPDGSGVLCTELVARSPARYAVVIVPTGPGEAQTLASGATEAVYYPIWHPTATEVSVTLPAESGRAAEILSFGLRGRPSRTINSGGGGDLRACAWSPDGRWLAIALSSGGEPGLAVVDVDNGRFARIPVRSSHVVGWLMADIPAVAR